MENVLNNLPHNLKSVFLNYYASLKSSEPKTNIIYCFDIDLKRNLLGFIFFSETITHNIKFFDDKQQNIFVNFERTALYSFDHNIKRYAHIFWIAFTKNSIISVKNNNKSIKIICNNNVHYTIHTEYLTKIFNAPLRKKITHKLFAFIAQLSFIKNKYENTWIFSDRPDKADDNAEHLYRWVRANIPSQKIFFVIDKNSKDWQRLKKDNFNLINLYSLEYAFAFMHCNWLISSHSFGALNKTGWRMLYADIVNHQFCFLQHGIIKDYMPQIARRNIDLFVTSTVREHESLAKSESYAYCLSEKEVVLTGLPRHDILLKKTESILKEKIIFIMPTWRQYLTDENITFTAQSTEQSFKDSLFYKNWFNILTDKMFLNLLTEYGYSIYFKIHPCFQSYLSDFEFTNCSQINMVFDNQNDTQSIQDILVRSSLLITDYSSIAMDFALLKKPVIYFQFDQEEFFEHHSCKKGYFDYKKDGFGEVATVYSELNALLESYLKNDCQLKEKYKKRIESFFCFFDQNNCQRVYDSIIEFSKPINNKN
ncbi:CDP-glycerol glycerophosphotransferase family protein [Desulfovibrio litoralis]|nr:CDP-glycerol glycerophosphotransferase family protein [Desulfovibrio litoralis]